MFFSKFFFFLRTVDLTNIRKTVLAIDAVNTPEMNNPVGFLSLERVSLLAKIILNIYTYFVIKNQVAMQNKNRWVTRQKIAILSPIRILGMSTTSEPNI